MVAKELVQPAQVLAAEAALDVFTFSGKAGHRLNEALEEARLSIQVF